MSRAPRTGPGSRCATRTAYKKVCAVVLDITVPVPYLVCMETTQTTQHDLGNNETISTGYAHTEQGYLALTRGESKWFKTEAGAIRWLARKGYAADGSRLA